MDDEEGGSEEEEAVDGEEGVEVVDEDRVCGDMQSVSSFIAFFLQKFLVVVGYSSLVFVVFFVFNLILTAIWIRKIYHDSHTSGLTVEV